VNSAIDHLNRMNGRPLRLLLVCPRFPTSYWSFHYVGRYARKTATMPPLGLLTIAALCPPDWKVRIRDEGVEPLTDADIAWADLVGLTSMLVQYDRAVYIARWARRLGKPTMIGGPHATGEPDVYTDEFDFLVLNEGEITFRQFLDDYAKGQVVARYETAEKADLAQTPVARYDLLPHRRRYMNFTIQFSRGCPCDCEFCDVTRAMGRRLRVRPPELFLRELDAMMTTGYQGPVFVADDNFTGNRRKAVELCEALAEWNVRRGNPYTYYTQAALDVAAQDDLLAALARARFNGLFIGFETPSAESLRGAGKTQNLRVDAAEAVRKIQSYGIRVDGGFIVGFDHDTPNIFRRQVEFIETINVSAAMVGILTAPYATPLFARLKAEGRLLIERTPLSPNYYLENYNIGGLMNVIPKNMPLPDLMEGYAYLLSRIYDPRAYFERVVRQIAALKAGPSAPAMTFKNVCVRLPLLTLFIALCFPCRFHYLRAAWRVLFRYPDRLKEFTMLVLRGIHYIEVTRREVVPWAHREAKRLEGITHHEETKSTKV